MKPRSAEKPIIAITVGDFNGIGPEVILRSVLRPSVRRLCRPVLVGPESVFVFYNERFKLGARLRAGKGIPSPGASVIPIVDVSSLPPAVISPGSISEVAGRIAFAAIEHAVKLVQSAEANALVTGPVSKQAMKQAGVEHPGQTELIQQLSSSHRVAMMLVSPEMRIGLATIHIPVRYVAETVTRQLLREKIEVIHDALVRDWQIRRPKLAVLGLNPHAGEDGMIGNEEQTVIAPVIRELQATMKIEGPFPADSFFARHKSGRYDAIVAMFHDQGLIPLKMSSFRKAVNVSVGLNIVRTSPDHGTAFDIAGKGIADPGSMIEAIRLASLISLNRKQYQRGVQ